MIPGGGSSSASSQPGNRQRIRVEFLWFAECPNHEAARLLLRDTIRETGIEADVADIDATDPAMAERRRFPGSPTIRVNGSDVEPGFADQGDYTPRCRLYTVGSKFSGLPDGQWIRAALWKAARERGQA
jgi:hypothetical protein